jgi:MFS family permease
MVYAGVSGALLDLANALADSRTIVPMFISQLTGSATAVAVTEALRGIAFFLPQLFVAHWVQQRPYRKPLYVATAGARAGALALIAVVIIVGTQTGQNSLVLSAFLALWTVFSVSVGVAQVPYTDIFARVVPASQRSRLLGGRGLAGGVLAVVAGFAVSRYMSHSPTTVAPYAAVFAAAAGIYALSAVTFAAIPEPPAPLRPQRLRFGRLLAENVLVMRSDARLRTFLIAQTLDAVVLAALPFYVVQVAWSGALPAAEIGLLLAAQTVGGVGLNPLWGWWGDRYGKLALLRLAAPLLAASPLLAIMLGTTTGLPAVATQALYVVLFFLNGASGSARIVGDLGYLMQISPDNQRAEYSGYLNTWLAPMRLLPVFAALVEPWITLNGIFAFAALAAVTRMRILASVSIQDGELSATTQPGPHRTR